MKIGHHSEMRTLGWSSLLRAWLNGSIEGYGRGNRVISKGNREMELQIEQ